MQIFKNISRYIALMTAFFASMAVNALDLPTKTINGNEYYFYTVQPKETIYTVTHKLGVTKADILKYNPAVIDGLRPHDTLYFPVTAFSESQEETAVTETAEHISHKVKRGETIYGISRRYNISTETLIAHNPSARDGIKSGETLVIPISAQITDESTQSQEAESDTTSSTDLTVIANADEDAEQQEVPTNNSDSIYNANTLTAITEPAEINIAVMLPFMLKEVNPSKQTQLFTEFYKGALIAVNDMRGCAHINVYAYDTADSLEHVKALLRQKEFENMDVIIAPSNDEQIKAIADFCNSNDSYVINMFDVKGDFYKTNKHVLQANIPQDKMYSKAIDCFIEECGDRTPVITKNLEKLSDKAQFINTLKNRLDSIGKPYIELPYSDILTDEDLALLDTATTYMFIPTSGARDQLSGIITTLTEFGQRCNDIKLFGYPEWTTFKGAILEKMHSLNTVVYSRFYNNTNSIESNAFESSFELWYGGEMIPAAPYQGILGYDTAMFIIKSACENNGIFIPGVYYQGIQSTFDFNNTDSIDGQFNNALYIIKYSSDGQISQSVK